MNLLKIVIFLSLTVLQISCVTYKNEPRETKLERKVSNSNTFCAEEDPTYTNADGTQIILCQKMYQQRPYIRPPQDIRPKNITNTSTQVTIYGGLYRSPAFGTSLVDRNGLNFKVLSPKDKISSKLDSLLKKIKFPSNRILFTLYKVTGTVKLDKTDSSYNIVIQDIEPVLQLSGESIDTHFVGTSLEGAYYFNNKIMTSIRIKLTGISEVGEGLRKLSEWDAEPKIEDADVKNIDGVVENLDKSVLSNSNECFKALVDTGDKNPFIGATNPKIAMRRIGRMHVRGDSVVAFDYPTKSDGQPAEGITRVGMAAENRFLNVINFIQLKYDETLPWGKLNIKPHGPNHLHELRLSAVEGKDPGGEICH